MLDNAYDAERRALELQKVDQTIDDAKREEARLRLDRLDDLKKGDAARIDRQYEGPMASYLRSIPDTADEINDALESIAVNGLRDVEDGFGRAAAKALGLKGVLGDVVAEMIKLVAQQAILAATGQGGGWGGFLNSIGTMFGGARAHGGPVSAGRSYVVGEKGPEILRMGAAGTIIPNDVIASRPGTTTIVHQHFNLDARYGITSTELIEYTNNVALAARESAVKQSRADLNAISRPRL